MFKSAVVYRIAPDWFAPSLSALEDRLDQARFVPCGPTDARSAGWVEPRGRENAALVESVDGQLILSLRTETRAVPASAVKRALDERLQRIEDETGSRPRGKRRKELKEEVVIDLLPRAFSKFSTTRVWIDPGSHLLVIGTGSTARADETVAALMEVLRGLDDTFAASPVKTELSASTAMSMWLSDREAPAGFSIDRECELRQAQAGAKAEGAQRPVDGKLSTASASVVSDEKATVRYARHALDIDEIVGHIEQGKQATKLAMTWQDRVSFMLDASMKLGKIEILDVAIEQGGGGQGLDAEDGFEADVAISTSELGRLIPDLVEALGGEVAAANAAAAIKADSEASTDAGAAKTVQAAPKQRAA
jgi:recombination associated protein RdgC